MPIFAEPLVRTALDTLRRLVESQPCRPSRVGLNAARAATDSANHVPASGSGELGRQHRDLRQLGALARLCSTYRFTIAIPAAPAAIPIVTDGVVELLEELRWPKQDVMAVELALQEALANAIRHGCRGDGSKHVRCSVSCDQSGEVVMVVRDPGPGFDPGAIADPLDAANILEPSGRGIFLIKELMDEVRFGDGGREVRMRKQMTPDVGRASE